MAGSRLSSPGAIVGLGAVVLMAGAFGVFLVSNSSASANAMNDAVSGEIKHSIASLKAQVQQLEKQSKAQEGRIEGLEKTRGASVPRTRVPRAPGVRVGILEKFLKQPDLKAYNTMPYIRLGTDLEYNDPQSTLGNLIKVLGPYHNHRKSWEFAAIADALERTGMLAPGKRGLGFGVGLEPLSTYFVTKGCDVVVSDAPTGGGWKSSAQFAENLRSTFSSSVPNSNFDEYQKHARFMPIDMNNIPSDLLQGDFDFTWSAGSFEHVGGEKNSVRFFLKALDALKPGGVAAHTTEFLISRDEPRNTEVPHMTVFSETVMREMLREAESRGYETLPMDLALGERAEAIVDPGNPYRSQNHWYLQFSDSRGPFLHCSVLIIVRKKL